MYLATTQHRNLHGCPISSDEIIDSKNMDYGKPIMT